MYKKNRRRSQIIKKRILLSLCVFVLVATLAIVSVVVFSIFSPDKTDKNISSKPQASKPEPEPIKESYATVLSIGDIMVHSPQLNGAYLPAAGVYDFTDFFKEISPYFMSADLSVANLEVTFGSTAAGAYSGYPLFNCPDSLADAIKSSGLNFLVTANNHSYDTGYAGLVRTAQVLKEKGIEFVGTRENTNDRTYAVKEINDIKIGIANYTYETSNANTPIGTKFLNGNYLNADAVPLVNSFNYYRLDDFYADVQATIDGMKSEGAEFITFYMHWGNEYKTVENTWQQTIAQQLSNMGVDLIIGSHPHVIEPARLIHSEDGQRTTICLYSAGNAVSNQRQELMDSCPSGHTEDGLIFSYTLKKYGEDVSLESVKVIPTWVNKYPVEGRNKYTIYPMEAPDWGTVKYGLNSTAASKAANSYERTKAILAEGLTEIQNALGCEVTFN